MPPRSCNYFLSGDDQIAASNLTRSTEQMRNTRRARVLRSYIRPFFRVCVAICERGTLLSKLIRSSRQDVVIALTESSQPVRDLASEDDLSSRHPPVSAVREGVVPVHQWSLDTVPARVVVVIRLLGLF